MKYFFIHNMDTCAGCCACQVACKDYHHLHSGDFFRRVAEVNAGGRRKFISLSCAHCERPLCVEACPFHAYVRMEDGTVIHDDSKCIGCGRCSGACPYGAIIRDTDRGIAAKCDGCYDRRREGMDPVCVAACINGSLSFGISEFPDEELKDCIPGVLPDPALSLPKYRYHYSGCSTIEREQVIPYFDHIILGAGAAGMRAAALIRELEPEASVALISREKELPYIRPLLTKLPLERFDHRKAQIKPAEWFAENRIELLKGVQVISLDTASSEVCTDSGNYRYGKCIYALGADSFVPAIAGREHGNVFTVRGVKDLYAVKRASLRAKNAVIIGGGVIGLETASMLSAAGLNVTVAEQLPYLMPGVLDEESSEALRESLSGFDIITGKSVKEINGDKYAQSVVLTDGKIIPADMVIMSCGNSPCTLIADNAGIKTGRGVIVNRYMETSAGNVYSCGDCAEFEGKVSGLWDEALLQAETAALNACGRKTEYQPPVSELVMDLKGLSLYAAGDLGKKNGARYRIVTSVPEAAQTAAVNPGNGRALIKRYYENDSLCGIFALGLPADVNRLRKELRR